MNSLPFGQLKSFSKDFRVYLKIGNMTNSEGDFSFDEAIFPREYFVYCKGKWCTAGGKDPLFGRVDGFQIDPNWSSV